MAVGVEHDHTNQWEISIVKIRIGVANVWWVSLRYKYLRSISRFNVHFVHNPTLLAHRYIFGMHTIFGLYDQKL